MKDMLAVVFSDKNAARAGLLALAEMDREHGIRVDSLDVINKTADGTVSRERMEEEFPIGTVAWMALGGLAGLLGGPFGVAIGMGAAALLGFIGDRYTAEETARFLTDVSMALTPGKYAIVADVEEDSMGALDAPMQAVGGLVVRTLRSSGSDIGPRQVAALRTELNQLKAAHAKVFAERKENLQVQRVHLLAREHTVIQEQAEPAGLDLRHDEVLEGQMSHLSAMEDALGRDRARAEQAELLLQERIEALQRQVNNEQTGAKIAVDGHDGL